MQPTVVEKSVEDEPILVESLCPKCMKTGLTSLYASLSSDRTDSTVVSSFACPHCGHQNNDYFDTQAIKERGVVFTLRVGKVEDLTRRVVLSRYASVRIPEIDLEVPPGMPCVTTVEGVLVSVMEGLSADQEERKQVVPDVHAKIQDILAKLLIFKTTFGFTLVIEDPSGNALIESTAFSTEDAALSEQWFARNAQQAQLLGLVEDDNPYVEEIYSFHDSCPCCSRKCHTNMKQVEIPFFKEVIIMCTSCEHCGYKSNDVKTGGAIPERGRVITLRLTGPEDLSRDILISETCRLRIPEIEFDVTGGSIGGKFTTVEGLLDTLYDELNDKVSLYIGDASSQTKERFSTLMDKIDQLRRGELEASLVLTDPLAGSYIQNPVAPMADPSLTISEYERSEEENDSLGISTMVV